MTEKYLRILRSLDKAEAKKAVEKMESFKHRKEEWRGKVIEWENICEYFEFPMNEAFVNKYMTDKFGRMITDIKILALTGCVASPIIWAK